MRAQPRPAEVRPFWWYRRPVTQFEREVSRASGESARALSEYFLAARRRATATEDAMQTEFIGLLAWLP